MSILKRKQSRTETADKSRRSFFWKLGAGVSGALAAPAVVSGNEVDNNDSLALRVSMLEEERSLRSLHQTFERAVDNGSYEQLIELFADDAQIIFNGGIFDNRSGGVRRLFRDRFPASKTGRRMEPAPGFALAADRQQDNVTLSQDLLSATAVFPYSIQAGTPIESEASLVSMARLHGEGVQTWWEGGVYHVVYRRSVVDGRWQISRLEYRTLSRADYRAGRSYAKPISVPRIATRYPEDRHGPDELTG